MTTIVEESRDQSEIIAFLCDQSSHGGAMVERVDTHLSHIFLTNNRAYKLKRAIAYDFVDFSTVDKRRAACERELEVNRRTAPALYRAVRPLYRSGRNVDWRGEGRPVEWVVEMARFDSDEQFDRLLTDGRLTAAHMRALADQIAAFHAQADICSDADTAARTGKVVDGLIEGVRKGGLAAIDAAGVEHWAHALRSCFDEQAAFCLTRAHQDKVRRCHGDMHLGNICLFDGAPTLFDAIEFNEDLARIDVLYDLAFLLMDLIHCGADDYANLVFNRYLSRSGDYSGVALIPLYIAMRASVRAMVLSLPDQPRPDHVLAGRYLADARAALAPRAAPRLFAVGGLSGSGKSTLAAGLAPALDAAPGAIVIRSDVVRKGLYGVEPEDKLPSAAYAPAVTMRVDEEMACCARRALGAGRSVVLDATFISAETRAAARRLADEVGVEFCGVWLDAPFEVLAARIRARRDDASDADVAILERQMKSAKPPAEWLHVDASRSAGESLAAAKGDILGG